MFYEISGKGVNEYPFDIFKIERDTGALSVNKQVDREEIAVYKVSVEKATSNYCMRKSLFSRLNHRGLAKIVLKKDNRAKNKSTL